MPNSHNWSTLALAVPAAFLLALLLTRWFLDPASYFHILDNPNHRSLHRNPTPRSGGLAFLFSVAVVGGVLAVMEIFWQGLLWVAAGVLVLVVVGAIDDLKGVSPGRRLLLQILSAAMMVAAGLVPVVIRLPGLEISLPLMVGVPLTLLFIVWMTNLYNFMDGMDGLAGSMAMIGFSTLAWMALSAGDFQFVAVNSVIAAAVAGFLVWNFPPARIFMGDAGAPVLGYLAAAMILWGASRGLFPLVAGIILFSPFIVDASYTLVGRGLRGERLWEAHRTHLYQQLVQAGWSHRKTLLWACLLMACCAVIAFRYSRADGILQGCLLLGWALLMLLVINAVRRLLREPLIKS